MTTQPSRVESAVSPRPRLAALRQEVQAEQMAASTATVLGQLPMRVDLTIYQGDDFFLNVAVDDSVIPIDLSTYTAKAEIRASAGAATVMASFVATIADPLTVALHLTNPQSDLLVSNGSWDVEIKDPAGVVTTLAYGSVTVVKQVTR